MAGTRFIMAGGGSGGHVVPLVAVARELRARGHECIFIGTRTGFEARLVPSAGFPIEYIEIGGLNRVGVWRTLRTLAQLPLSIVRVLRYIRRMRPRAVFSLGGYVAGPVVLAAWCARLPMAIMEPNAAPGLTNRYIGRVAARVLVNFPDAARFFPKARTEVTGLPVRAEFFELPVKTPAARLTVLITGGSQGSRTLNEAARESWKYFREARVSIEWIHQTGRNRHAELAREFAESGMEGEVFPFIEDMPAAFARADLIVCRAGGTTAELAAAGKASILAPLPTAAGNHQFHNARAFENAGAARLVPDREMNGRRLFDEIQALNGNRALLREMGRNATLFAHPGAARRAADIMEQLAG